MNSIAYLEYVSIGEGKDYPSFLISDKSVGFTNFYAITSDVEGINLLDVSMKIYSKEILENGELIDVMSEKQIYQLQSMRETQVVSIKWKMGINEIKHTRGILG